MWESIGRPDSPTPGATAADGELAGMAAEPAILLVEDEVVVNFFLKTLFEDKGFPVVMTTTAAEALQAIEEPQSRFCAAVIDVGLPDTPGDELVPLIRSTLPDLPIVIATGFSEAEVGRRFLHDVRVRVIGKPFDGSHLFSALNSLDAQFGL
jgi:CheY-like chemotaxis protein